MGDIAEIFLQVSLLEQDRKYHRFLWQGQVFEFMRLVFGIKASPYLACKALQEVGQRFAPQFKSVGSMVTECFYVDDLLCSLPSVSEAIKTQRDLQEMLRLGGFHLRKWLSSSKAVVNAIPECDRAPEVTASISDRDHCSLPSIKMLGIVWSAESDCFTFKFEVPSLLRFTKRDVLSKMASIFDPRGLISPFTIRAKVLFQAVCLREKAGTTKWMTTFVNSGRIGFPSFLNSHSSSVFQGLCSRCWRG